VKSIEKWLYHPWALALTVLLVFMLYAIGISWLTPELAGGILLSAAVAGLRGTGDWGTDERPKNFREMILWRRPNGRAPLTALLSKTKSQKVDDPEWNWWEEELNAVRLQINYGTGYATSATSIVVDSGNADELVAGDVLLVEGAITTSYSHEILVVSSVTDSSNLVVKRGQAGTTAATIANDVYLTKIGSVFAEGSTSPEAASRNPTKLNNYAQIFKTAYRITETAKLTRARTGAALSNDKKRKMFDHSVALELAFLFGKRYEAATGGSNGKPIRFTGGFLYMLSQYASSRITAFTTSPTETTLLDAIYPIWDYDTDAGDERICFAGNGFLNNLNKLAKDSSSTRINFNGIVEVYGMKLAEWIFPQGRLYVRTHPLFNTHGRFTNDAFIFDPTVVLYRFLRDTKSMNNIQANDADEEKGQWLTEAGLEFQHAKTSAWLSNFTI
jgi:hypothetical protein